VSVNKHKSHLYILPEDDDDNELANGFIDNLWVNDCQAQVLPVAGGWMSVLERFKTVYIPHLRQYAGSNIVLLIDFDEDYEARSSKFAQEIPDDLRNRAFVIGVLDEPQDLKKSLNLSKNFEEIGSALADDCHGETTTMWDHPHLKHNDPERVRLMKAVKSILFDP
jgi:hypothetical protein